MGVAREYKLLAFRFGGQKQITGTQTSRSQERPSASLYFVKRPLDSTKKLMVGYNIRTSQWQRQH